VPSPQLLDRVDRERISSEACDGIAHMLATVTGAEMLMPAGASHLEFTLTKIRRCFWGAHLSWKPGGCPGRSVALGIAARHVMMPDCRQPHPHNHIGRTSSWTAVGCQDRFLPLHLQVTIHSYQCPRAFRGSVIAARSSISVISLWLLIGNNLLSFGNVS
jgi:hypothetical protein